MGKIVVGAKILSKIGHRKDSHVLVYFMFLYHLVELKIEPSNIEFKHVFLCINVCQAPR